MRMTIIIPVYNRKDDLKECLDTLPPGALEEVGAEIIVVDDGSTDGVGEMLQDGFPWVHVRSTSGNRGPAHARNCGADAARGELLVFLDSDAIPAPGWLQALQQHDDGRTILVGETRDYANGSIQGGPRRSTFLGKSLPCRPGRVNTGPSCNLAVPRKCFEAVGGFDESLPYYFEDSFFCIQAFRRGANFAYLPDARVRHKGSAVRRGEAIRMQEDNSTFAMLRLYHDHWWKRAAFTLGNGSWLLFRLVTWTLSGRFRDAHLLARGWQNGYKRYRAWISAPDRNST